MIHKLKISIKMVKEIQFPATCSDTLNESKLYNILKENQYKIGVFYPCKTIFIRILSVLEGRGGK